MISTVIRDTATSQTNYNSKYTKLSPATVVTAKLNSTRIESDMMGRKPTYSTYRKSYFPYNYPIL